MGERSTPQASRNIYRCCNYIRTRCRRNVRVIWAGGPACLQQITRSATAGPLSCLSDVLRNACYIWTRFASIAPDSSEPFAGEPMVSQSATVIDLIFADDAAAVALLEKRLQVIRKDIVDHYIEVGAPQRIQGLERDPSRGSGGRASQEGSSTKTEVISHERVGHCGAGNGSARQASEQTAQGSQAGHDGPRRVLRIGGGRRSLDGESDGFQRVAFQSFTLSWLR